MRTDGPTDGHTRTYLHTDRHDEANSRFSQSCERARKGAGSFPWVRRHPSHLTVTWLDFEFCSELHVF